MAIRAIICDLDRTLLRSDETISGYTLQTLKACRARGILLVAATARPACVMTAYQEQVGFDAQITTNGARIVTPGRTKLVTIDRAQTVDIIRRLSGIGDVRIVVETDDGFLSNGEFPELPVTVCPDLTAEPLPAAVYRIIASAGRVDLKEVLPAVLTEETYFSVAIGRLYQIMNRRATKWLGIRTALADFGIDPSEAVYFGDDQDDIEPIRCCGTGVAMRNAILAVREAADFVTDSNDEDGVAACLQAMILQKSRE